MEESRKEKFKSLVSKEASQWVKYAKWRQENHFWIHKSQRLALKILVFMSVSKISKKEFAAKIEVSNYKISKMVKGSCNFTLKEICKIESVLKMEFLKFNQRKRVIKLKPHKR